MSATLIRFKKNDVGDWMFSTFLHHYILVYTPAQSVRGAYWYELKRLDLLTEDHESIAEFGTLQKAREWITALGYTELDKISNRFFEAEVEAVTEESSEPLVEALV
jgi:hypothetical protein